MTVRVKGRRETWDEPVSGAKRIHLLPPENDTEAIEVAKATINYFNDTLREGERERELVKVIRIEINKKDIWKV